MCKEKILIPGRVSRYYTFIQAEVRNWERKKERKSINQFIGFISVLSDDWLFWNSKL